MEERLNINNIWTDFSGKLRQFIRNRVNDEFYADEILQEVFIKIHANVDTLKTPEKLSGWAFQIARNTIVDYYRKGFTHLTGLDENETYEDHPEDNFNRVFEQDIIDMMKYIPGIYREALELTEYKGMTQKEVSEKLGISLSGVKSRVQRGRLHIKDLLMKCCHIEFDRYGNIIDYHPHNCCCCNPPQKKSK